jgi:hypothetical protein
VLDPSVRFVTVEADPGLAAAAAGLFAAERHVRVLHGGWRELRPGEVPLDLVFVDVADAKDDVEAGSRSPRSARGRGAGRSRLGARDPTRGGPRG